MRIDNNTYPLGWLYVYMHIYTYIFTFTYLCIYPYIYIYIYISYNKYSVLAQVGNYFILLKKNK